MLEEHPALVAALVVFMLLRVQQKLVRLGNLCWWPFGFLPVRPLISSRGDIGVGDKRGLVLCLSLVIFHLISVGFGNLLVVLARPSRILVLAAVSAVVWWPFLLA